MLRSDWSQSGQTESLHSYVVRTKLGQSRWSQMEWDENYERSLNSMVSPGQLPQPNWYIYILVIRHCHYAIASINHASQSAVASVILCVCACVCPLSKWKTTWAINTKLGTHVLHGRTSTYIDHEGKRSKSHGYKNVTNTRLLFK